MFDEPSYGLAPKAVAEIFRVIKLLPGRGITVVLVEQNVKQALEMADRACVLENGRLTGSAPQAPRLQGGVKERNELRFIPIREAPRLQGGELHSGRTLVQSHRA
jgi:branched-chain amino acid transport system ATP-binding protein